MSLKTSPKSVTMAVLDDDATNIGSSQNVPSYDVVAQCSRFDQRPAENSCKKRRRMPMRLSLPLHEVFNFRRSRKKGSRKSTKSRSSSEEKMDIPISAEEIEDGASPSGSQRLYSGDDLKTCAICFNEISFSKFPKLLMCDHRFCSDCLRIYLITEIFDSRVNITCPECPKMMHPNDIRMILNEESLLEKYEIFMLRRHLTCEPDTRWCPATDCNYGVIATGCASCPKLKCERPGCETDFCYHCRQLWHPNKTCDDARVKRTSMILKASNSDDLQTTLDTKACPRCSALIAKMEDGSCNHMTCVICGAEFCWLCMKQISDLHYLSPSGCTFWGKKPWSKKKKVLWQIGTLIGAPLGIALIAGLTVPAMIIGIPIYVGRKLFKRYNDGQVSNMKRNIIVIAGVATSIIIAPVLAALTVSVGVPILLAYVYGVVPISLCRTGGCGITKTQNGVRLEVDEQLASSGSPAMVRCESVVGGSTGSARSDRKVSLTGQGNSTIPTDDSGWDLRRVGIASEGSDCDSRKSANRKLSILSENTTEDETDRKNCNSASAMSKGGISASIVHIERENDCVSNTAIAGESLSGSICGSTGYNPNVKVRKSSFGSDSMNYSLCDNVSNITYPESLAGAIIDTSNGHQQQPHHGASSSDSTGGNLVQHNQPPHASLENSSNSSAQEITAAASSGSATGTGASTTGASGSVKSGGGAGRVGVSSGAAKSNHRHSNRSSSDNNSISVERNGICSARSKSNASATLRVSPATSSAATSYSSLGLHATSVVTHPKHATCKNGNHSQPKVTLSERSSVNVPIAASVVAEVTTEPIDCGDDKKQASVFEDGDGSKVTESNIHHETLTKNAEEASSLLLEESQLSSTNF